LVYQAKKANNFGENVKMLAENASKNSGFCRLELEAVSNETGDDS
jgi:hypothetical protein